MKYLVLIACLFVACSGTRENRWVVGDGTPGDKEIIANNGDANPPKMVFDQNSGSWQVSNDGSSFEPVGGGSSASSFQLGENVNAQDGLEVRADGKAYKVSQDKSLTDLSFFAQSGDASVGYNPTSSKFLYFDEGGGNQVRAAILEQDEDGSFTLQNQVTQALAYPPGNLAACDDKNQNKTFLALSDDNSGLQNNYYLVDVVAGSPVFGNTTTNGATSVSDAFSRYECHYDPVSQKILGMISQDLYTGRMEIEVINNQTGSPVYEAKFQVPTSGASTVDGSMAFSTATNRWLVSASISSGSIVLVGMNTSSGSPVFGTPVTISVPGNSNASNQLSYDEVSGNFVYTYTDTSTQEWRAGTVTMDASLNITVNPALVIATGVDALGLSNAIYIARDDANDKHYAFFTNGGSYELTVAGTTIASSPLSPNIFWANPSNNVAYTGYGTDGFVFAGYDNFVVQGYAISAGFPLGLLGENFLAVANESGLTDESKNITFSGPQLSGFTGQTPGSKAYLQDDSTITSTPSSFEVGTFISPTDMVVTKLPKTEAPLVTYYNSSTVTLSGSPQANRYTSGTCRVERINKTVTLNCSPLNGQSSLSAFAIDVIPLWARPKEVVRQVVLYESSFVVIMTVQAGSANVGGNYKTLAGSNVARSGTNTGFGMTWVVED